MKRVWGIFLILTFSVLITACDNALSDTGKADNHAGESFPENLIMLEAGEWPQNGYTETVPQPKVGTLLRGWIDLDKEFCYLELSDITQTECEQYVRSLKEAGFSEAQEDSEVINDDCVSVGTLLISGDVFVSIAYSDDSFGMYIKYKQQWQ